MSMSYDLNKIYSNYLSEVGKQYEIYKEVDTNPELILTKMFDPEEHQPFYNHMYHVLESGGVGFHDIQKNIFNKLKEYFHSLDEDIELEMSYGSRVCYIKYKDKKIINFSFYNHTYGDERFWHRVERYQNDLINSIEYLNDLCKELVRWSEFQINIYSLIGEKENGEKINLKGLGRLKFLVKQFLIVTFKQKNIRKNLDIKVNRLLEDIEKQKKIVFDKEEQLKKAKEIRPLIDSKYDEWERRLIGWKYTGRFSNIVVDND